MLAYMGRCSYRMQQGEFVADVCFYYGDQAPNLVPPRRIDPHVEPRYALDKCLHCGRPRPVDVRPLGSGYDFDYVDARSILDRMAVDSDTGRLVVGDMSYALMVLPAHAHISLDVLRKVRELVVMGATVLGPVRPARTNSLTDFPRADQEVSRIGAELWSPDGSNPGDAARSQRCGKGRVFTNMTSRQVLARMGVAPDFTVLRGGSQEGPDRIDYIHRRTGNADVYFVCNSADEARSLLCRFRDAGGRPEIWCPVTGEIRAAKVANRGAGGPCDIELELPAIGSAFVVFRRDGEPPSRPPDLLEYDSPARIPIEGTWHVRFEPGRRAPESVAWKELIDWTTSEEPGIKHFSGTATYSIPFDWPEAATGDFWLDLGTACEVAEVRIDGRRLGTAWTYPFRMRVPADLLSKGPHELEVGVTNVWNNRIVGDQFLGEEERVTRTNLQGRHDEDSPLVPSGLLGPVTLQQIR